jgi:hypothetical protein
MNFGFELKVHGSKHLLFSFYLPSIPGGLFCCSWCPSPESEQASKQLNSGFVHMMLRRDDE